MELTYCAQCAKEIEGKGIQFRGRVFCCDECCEECEAEIVDKGEPGFDDLADPDLDEVVLDDDGQVYRTGDDVADEDDEFDIAPDDF